MFDRRQSEQFKHQVRASFDTTPATYGTSGDFHWLFAQRLVERAPLDKGQRVLDVATGTAPAAIMAARIVGSTGVVIGIDLSPGIVERAKQNITAAGMSNVAVQVGDAEQLPYADTSFDGILCSSAIVWFPDMLRAVREWYRVLRPGGWITFSCFGGLARQTINDLIIRLLKPYGISFPELNTPLNTPGKCRALVEQAGFRDVTVQTANEQQWLLDGEERFQRAWASGSRFNISLPPAEFVRVEAQYLAAFATLVPTQAEWNHDTEQFVIAYKLAEGAAQQGAAHDRLQRR